MFPRLLLALTIVPLVELMILFRLAEAITWSWTIAMVVLTGILGAWLARREGLRALTRIQSDLDKGVLPTGPVLDAVLILIAGVVLVTPGVLTDVAGFALLIAPFRRFIGKRLAAIFRNRFTIVTPDQRDVFVDVEPVESSIEDEPNPSQDRLERHES